MSDITNYSPVSDILNTLKTNFLEA